MMSKKVFLGSIGAVLVAATALFVSNTNETETGLYQSRSITTNKQEQGIRGAFEYYNMIYSDMQTGEFNKEAYDRARAEVTSMAKSGDRAEMTFIDQGPDNVGGRTRAILIDKDDYRIVYAGSVSGGLFKSTNRGSTWKKVEGFFENLAISSMCQTDNGNLFVATGHSEEGFNGGTNSGMEGDGVFYSTDNGETFTQIPGTDENDFINEIVALGNKVLIGGQEGLEVYDNGTLSDFTGVAGNCGALAISADQQVIVADLSNHRTYISTDGGTSFTNVSGSEASGLIPSSGVGRMEYAISHEKVDGKYYIYASQSTGAGRLRGVFYTKDYGASWTRIAPASTGAPGDFTPFGANAQGNYDQIITVVPGQPESILFGGIEVYSKSLSGNWELRSNGFVPELNPLYVHSDQHEMVWDSQGRIWLGTDGGVFWSDDNGLSFRESNRGYNVTQFYGISASAHGDVMGGAQDNGTQVNYHNNHTYREHDRWSGGDGFTCAMSFINRDVAFSTLYFGLIFRSGDRGFNVSTYTASNIPASFGVPGDLTGGNPLGSFYTSIELYENPNDLNSKDSILYFPVENLDAGETVDVPSATSQQTLTYTLTESVTFDDTLFANTNLTIEDTIITDSTGVLVNLYGSTYTYVVGMPPLSVGDSILIDGTTGFLIDKIDFRDHFFGTNPNEPGEVVDMGINPILQNISWDTLKVQDTYQSWLALGLGGGDGLWLTRNALRFSATHDGFIKAGAGISGNITEMQFSKDGNHLFVGTSIGRIYRLSGLNDIYSPNPILGTLNGNIEDSLLYFDHPNTQATFDLIATLTGPILGIDTDRDNPDLIVVATGGFATGSHVRKSINATSASPTFTDISGNMPSMLPCLSIMMDRDDPDEILVGTAFGLFRTQNGGTAWEVCDAPFGLTPIFDLFQNWRSWDEGNLATGQVYIGTHGRGIWSTNEFLSVDEPTDNINTPASISDLLLFPNPVVMDANLTFNVKEAGKGTVRVFDLKGQLIINMENVSLNEGDNIVTLGLSDLAKGTYVVNLTTDQASKTTKFIKQ